MGRRLGGFSQFPPEEVVVKIDTEELVEPDKVYYPPGDTFRR